MLSDQGRVPLEISNTIVDTEQSKARSYVVVKRVIDIIGATALGLFLLPLMAIIAIFIRLNGSTVFFCQKRLGRHGAEFRFWKFRTMVPDAERALADYLAQHPEAKLEWDRTQKLRDDPRVTPVGRWLRRLSLDELPQLLNVLDGTMSLVGPRPPLPTEVARYDSQVRRRLLVKPGLTGLWQISGRSDLPWEEAVRLDLRYVENWSLAMDLLILVKTVRAVLGSSGAY